MRMIQRLVPAAAGFALLVAAIPVRAQSFTSASSGSSGGSTGSGSSLGSGSSFGSTSGSSGSTSGFLGSSGSGTSGSSSTGIGVMSTTGSSGSRSGSGSTTPGSTTFIGQSFVNPLALGFSGLSSFSASSANPTVIKSSQFGNPLFTITPITNPIGGNTNSRNGTSGIATVTPVSPSTPYSASSYGMRRVPSYVTEPRFNAPAVSLRAIEGDVRGAIARSSGLQAPGNTVSVRMDGPVVILHGVVTNMDQLHLAEDVIRLTPGVQAVRNELLVKAQ